MGWDSAGRSISTLQRVVISGWGLGSGRLDFSLATVPF